MKTHSDIHPPNNITALIENVRRDLETKSVDEVKRSPAWRELAALDCEIGLPPGSPRWKSQIEMGIALLQRETGIADLSLSRGVK